MKTNFQFLKDEFTTLYDRAVKAEKFVITDPRTSLVYSRMALEEAVHWMYANDEELEPQYNTTLHNLLVQPFFKQQFNHKLYSDLFIIKSNGNAAAHNKAVNDVDSHKTIEALFYFTKWFIKSYAQNEVATIGIFDYSMLPKEGNNALTKKQIKELKATLDEELNAYQKQLKAKEAERQQLASENELFKKRIAELQAQIESNKVVANEQDEVQHPRNEVETRLYLIDIALREAGWDLNGANDKEFLVSHMPISTNKSGTGKVDYVLWDDDGLPLALVEAKRTIESATKGENQAQLYADSLEKMYGRRPVMYYTNGYEIYLWDDQFYKQARKVHGFYTKAELQTLMFRRSHRKDIRKATIDTEIAGRFYQMRSIRSIAEHFSGNDKRTGKLIGTNREALLVLATGTGKTRTAIAFSKMLLASNWAKRILFLADRTSLVDQAKRNFVKFLPEHTSVNLIEEKDNPDARLAFSTYQTMMGLINNPKEMEYYGVGHFDLIIVDEAHRSIYKKYHAIFDYFDALFLGLTATPIDTDIRNTYHTFGLASASPTDAYTFDEAVERKHLVPYKSIELPTKFLREGIRYDELSAEDKEQYEREILDGEEAVGNEWVSSSELNQWLFNKSTAIETLRYVLQHGIKKRGGEELGKTIIFAKNKKHAHFLKDTLLELDKELFGNDYVKVITHGEPKAKEFINRFCDEEKDRLPQIAISVDMMDTGIDAPSCVNLVFYKPVRSFAKFWQMIGRGSRLRPNLFGEGEDKTHFLIFDLCQNFEFFKENPKGTTPTVQKSLSETLFGLRMDLAEYLKTDQFINDEYLQHYRTNLLEGMYQDIAILDLDRFDVKMKLEFVHKFGKGKREVWNHLSKQQIRTIEEELAPLVKPKKGETDLARYYDKLIYKLIKKRLETQNSEEFIDAFKIPIKKVVETSKKILPKTTITSVKEKEELLKFSLDIEFWKTSGINHLEKLRKGVRELVKHIEPEDQRYVTTDFADYILDDKIVKGSIANNDGEPYAVTTPFHNTVYRLQEIIREHKNNVTIARIRNGEKITKQELGSLEKLLFKDGLTKDALEKELNKKLDLVDFIVKLLGLSQEKVDQAFAQLINKYELSSVQIEFLNTIKEFLTVNGTIEPSKLYEAPFKNYHSLGVDGVFNQQQADLIFKIVEDFNEAN